MLDKGSRLGRGLEGLIPAAREGKLTPAAVSAAGLQVTRLPMAKISPNPWQPRKTFDTHALNELVESLRGNGLMQPLVVRPHGNGFQIIAGERRFRAANELGWTHIDAICAEADDRRMMEWALLENIQRQDLNPLELAEGIHNLIQANKLGQDEAAKRLSMSRPAVANHLRLLELPAGIRARVAQGSISMGAARALLGIKDKKTQEDAARRVAEGLLTVRQVEALAQGKQTAKQALDPNLKAVGEEIQSLLGTRVQLRGRLDRGRVIVSYSSRRQLDGLLRRLRELEDERGAAEAGGGILKI
jgi:ParB family chromosome partitioning protein